MEGKRSIILTQSGASFEREEELSQEIPLIKEYKFRKFSEVA
jgi:hypothetical protein